jgi:hypothetical protein
LHQRAVAPESEVETGTFKGTVRDSDGRPIRGAVLSAYLGSPEPVTRVTREDGSFVIDSIKPGNYFVRVTASRFAVSTGDVTIAAGRAAEVAFELQRGPYEIAGRVTEDGRKPLKAEVTVLKSSIVVQSAMTSETSGAYRFRYLSGGLYEVQASSVCHLTRAWSGAVSGKTMANLTLPVVEGCTRVGKCDVCGLTKEVKYCQFCHAYICGECRDDYPERIKAMIRRMLSKKDRRPEIVDKEYEKLLVERRGCAGCP